MRRESRRTFLGKLAGAMSAPMIVPASVLGLGGATPPSERVGVGFIGLGSRGNNHLDTMLGRQDVRVLAVCDPYQSKCESARKKVAEKYKSSDCATFQDYRKLLARDDIDAVFIASPENWHAIQGAAAVATGKDVYGEKALSLTVHEGRALVKAVRQYGRVFQVGTQQRSSRDFRYAAELVRNGYIGTLKTVKVAVPGGRPLPDAPATPPPPDLDYEMWLGPAPYTPHNDVKCTFNWYFMRDYCAGWIQSWGVHHLDSALWAAPQFAEGRVKLQGTAMFPRTGLADTSVTWRVEVETETGLRMTFSDDTQEKIGCRFEGSDGWVYVDRSGIWAGPDSLLSVSLKQNDERLYVSNDHHQNFLDCIRTRRDPVAPVEGAHTATTLSLAADIATRMGRPVTWDWAAESFVNDDEAARLLGRSMREPWQLNM